MVSPESVGFQGYETQTDGFVGSDPYGEGVAIWAYPGTGFPEMTAMPGPDWVEMTAMPGPGWVEMTAMPGPGWVEMTALPGGGWPAMAATAGAAMGTGISAYWQNLFLQSLRQIESALPAQEVMHSLVHQMMLEPALRDLPAVQQVAETQQSLLNNLAATAGYLRRLLHGDASATTLAGLQQQIGSLAQARQDSRTALQALAAAEPERASETIRSILQVAPVAEQVQVIAFASVQPLVAGPAPLFSGQERYPEPTEA